MPNSPSPPSGMICNFELSIGNYDAIRWRGVLKARRFSWLAAGEVNPCRLPRYVLIPANPTRAGSTGLIYSLAAGERLHEALCDLAVDSASGPSDHGAAALEIRAVRL